jgi:hypothetical protein
MVVEFIQVTAMGPSVQSLNYTIWAVGMACSVDLSQLIDVTDGAFWILVDCFFGMVTIYFSLFVLDQL